MHRLNFNQLIDTYTNAIKLDLDHHFITLLETELRLRGVDPKTIKYQIV